MTDKLKDLRQKIDNVDARLVKLVSERARLVRQVGDVKAGATVYRPEREAQILRRVAELNPGPLPDRALQRVYTEVVSACRSLEDEMTIAFLGPEGTFSQEAAIKHFGGQVPLVASASIDEVFRRVETGAAGYAVVPVENSTEGAVGRTLDLLLATQMRVCGEVMLRVRQCLMNRSGRMNAIRKLYSHTQSLAQCQRWLARNLPHAEQVAVVSNAEAARLASKEASAGAIASKTAADLYGLRVVARNIQDDSNNTTRFLVLGGHDAEPSGRDKTSLILSTRNVPGAMHELLTPLAENRVSMTRFESRPARTGTWEYVFYVDIEGHSREPHVSRALGALERKSSLFKNLGSYPAAVS
jgi:chorismate mutase / prephenate dehydratase